MSEQTLLSSLKKQVSNFYSFGQPDGDGFGVQFRVYTQVTVSRVAIKMCKTGTPTGSMVARLYTSNGGFQSSLAKAGTQIAQSTNTLDVSTLSSSMEDVDFTFNNVILAPGIYFFVVFSSSIDTETGRIQIFMTGDGGSQFGYPTIWQSSGWLSWSEWD
jgi:hypothetical protein